MRKPLPCIIGATYGQWTIIRELERHERTRADKRVRQALVECTCGNRCNVRLWDIINGRSTMCQKCAGNKPKVYAIGDRYGAWTIVGPAPSVGQGQSVKVQCDCGTIINHKLTTLTGGHSQQCVLCAGSGCRRAYEAKAGDRWGNKTIIREDGYTGPHRMVLVRCDCGAERRVEFAGLRKGKVGNRCHA